MPLIQGWVFWALLSAVFAAATTVFAKIGVAGVDADLATFIRTVVVLVLVALFAFTFLGERPTGQDWLGIALVTADVLALTLK